MQASIAECTKASQVSTGRVLAARMADSRRIVKESRQSLEPRQGRQQQRQRVCRTGRWTADAVSLSMWPNQAARWHCVRANGKGALEDLVHYQRPLWHCIMRRQRKGFLGRSIEKERYTCPPGLPCPILSRPNSWASPDTRWQLLREQCAR